MRDYVQSKKSKREIIMGYFGFSPLPLDTAHACCDYHEKLCNCVLSDVASVMASTLTDEAPPLSNEDVYPYSLFRTKHGSNFDSLDMVGHQWGVQA